MTRTATLTVLLILAAFGLSRESLANMAPPVREFRVGMTLDKTDEGLRVASVEKKGVAANASVRVGDVVLAIEGRYWKAFSNSELKSFVNEPHTWPLSLILLRGDRESVETVHLAP